MSHLLDANDPAGIEEAARTIAEGGVVAFPTETVYGLGADAFNPRAVARVFEVKKRPVFDPLIVHVAAREAAAALWTGVPPEAARLMDAFWPGPLTIVLPKTSAVPDIVTSGLPTVAVRMPANAHALALIAKAGRPIAAPSANPFGRTSPTTARAVEEDFGAEIDAVLDGGPCAVGVESTVVKIENGAAVLLRPGGVPVEELRKHVAVAEAASGGPAESPGRLESHYAPGTPLVLLDGPVRAVSADLARLEKKCAAAGRSWPRLGLVAFGPSPAPAGFAAVENLSATGDLREAASNLFQAVRKLDRMGLDLIVAERVPGHGLGAAILDRLAKASSGRGAAGLASLARIPE